MLTKEQRRAAVKQAADRVMPGVSAVLQSDAAIAKASIRPVSHSMNVGNPGGPIRADHFPWSSKRGKYCLSVMDAKGYPIAVVQERPDQKANAALIAAAPELLAAVEALCAWGDHPALTGLPNGAPVADSAPSFDETVKMVHAAIAKANGQHNS